MVPGAQAHPGDMGTYINNYHGLSSVWLVWLQPQRQVRSELSIEVLKIMMMLKI